MPTTAINDKIFKSSKGAVEPAIIYALQLKYHLCHKIFSQSPKIQ